MLPSLSCGTIPAVEINASIFPVFEQLMNSVFIAVPAIPPATIAFTDALFSQHDMVLLSAFAIIPPAYEDASPASKYESAISRFLITAPSVYPKKPIYS